MEEGAAAEAEAEAGPEPQVDAEAEPEAAPFSAAVTDAFASHAAHVRARARARQECVRMKSVVHDDEVGEQLTEEDGLGKRLPSDEYQGDANVRTLKTLLRMVDERGFERSDHQLAFHDAFMKATARVLYKADWGVSKPAIMAKHGWKKVSSEVLISTPRRFGKTFR